MQRYWMPYRTYFASISRDSVYTSTYKTMIIICFLFDTIVHQNPITDPNFAGWTFLCARARSSYSLLLLLLFFFNGSMFGFGDHAYIARGEDEQQKKEEQSRRGTGFSHWVFWWWVSYFFIIIMVAGELKFNTQKLKEREREIFVQFCIAPCLFFFSSRLCAFIYSSNESVRRRFINFFLEKLEITILDATAIAPARTRSRTFFLFLQFRCSLRLASAFFFIYVCVIIRCALKSLGFWFHYTRCL